MSLPKPYYDEGGVTLHLGDCRDVLAGIEPETVDAVVTDPPYELGFMGRDWDSTGIAYDVEMWQAVFAALKPGGHLLAFGGSRTYHRMAVAIEDAGFEIRDQLQWLYGSGFPKSLDVSKAIDKAAGAEREVVGKRGRIDGKKRGHVGLGANGIYSKGISPSEIPETVAATPDAERWSGWGTALKPAHEPLVLARKPLAEHTVAANVLEHGTGAVNVDGCRIATDENRSRPPGKGSPENWRLVNRETASESHANGRWPANVILDPDAAALLDAQSGERRVGGAPQGSTNRDLDYGFGAIPTAYHGNGSGGASRFYYVAKASKPERGLGNNHPTVKPVALMRYLCRLITPPGGVILDPFVGSGSTAIAARFEGFDVIGIDESAEYLEIATSRMSQQVLPLEVAS